MWRKVRAIAWKDTYSAFKDRNAIMYMLVMPLALSAIVALAFGTGGDVSIDPVPVAVYNQDAGAELPNGQTLSFGAILTDVLAPPADAPEEAAALRAVVDGQRVDDLEAARADVNTGTLGALVAVTDPDFTAKALAWEAPEPVLFYYDAGRSVGSAVVQSIVNSITSGINATLIAQALGPQWVLEVAGVEDPSQGMQNAAALLLGTRAAQLGESQPIQVEMVDLQGETREFDALQYFAPSMAIMFMTFTMAAGATGILIESRHWTLQRILTTPTPRWVFMAGKLLGTYATGLFQMIALIVSTSLFALALGRQSAIWGTNWVGLALMVVTVTFAGTSLGLVIAALSKTPEQASTYSTVALFLLAMLGGTFIPIENLPQTLAWLPKVTLNYWGIQGFVALSYEQASVAEIVTYVAVLAGMGVVLFALSLWRFNRRLDV